MDMASNTNQPFPSRKALIKAYSKWKLREISYSLIELEDKLFFIEEHFGNFWLKAVD